MISTDRKTSFHECKNYGEAYRSGLEKLNRKIEQQTEASDYIRLLIENQKRSIDELLKLESFLEKEKDHVQENQS